MFEYFKTNTQLLSLIRFEFRNRGDKIAVAIAKRITSAAASNKPKLLDQGRDLIRRKHYSIRTEQAYADWRVKLLATR
jgi:hypothetical protein